MKIPVSFSITVDVKWWKDEKAVEFISTTANPDEFRFEGQRFIQWKCSDNKFLTLAYPFGQIEIGGNTGGMVLITDYPIPEGF